MNYRWIDGADATEAEWNRLDEILATRGWMSLSRATSRIRVAEDAAGNLRGFLVLQMVPHLGPAYVVPTERGSGLMELLVEDMQSFLLQSNARGVMIVADNPAVARLCEEWRLTRVKSPVYTTEAAEA